MKKFLSLTLILLLLMPSLACAAELTLTDNSNVTIKVKDFSLDTLWGLSMNVYLENKTDKTVMFSIENCVIDGYVQDPFWATELMPVSRSNTDVQWYDLDTLPTIIEFDIRAYDSNDWTADNLYEEHHVIYPQGEEAVQINEYQPKLTDIILSDNNNLSIIVTGASYDDIWGYTIDLYLHNKTNKNLMFSVENASLNGYTIDPFWANEVPAAARARTSISWMESDLEANSISAVETITLMLRAYDSDDWFANDIFNETLVFKP